MVQHGYRQVRATKLFVLAMLLLWWVIGVVPAARAADPAQGPGGPILVLTSSSSTFGPYHAEILRTEGLNAFAVADIGTMSAQSLAAYDVVLLSKMTLSPAQVTILTNWVSAGGNLIAMAPDSQLAPLLGISPLGTTLSNGYLLVNTAVSPGLGIVDQTMQFHGVADRYALNGATAVATLYSSATVVTTNPAVTLRTVGSGKAAAFMYDLATSVVYTRQGNPTWQAQERDGFAPIRSDDKFYGNSVSDPQADWIDLSKVAIPQADEQQRLLANLILHMNASRKPLPRFWYFPSDKKAVVVMSGDDHGNGGTLARFDQFRNASPAGCSVANWECVRATSYIFTSTPITDAQAGQLTSEGFEVGLHVNTGCADFTPASLQAEYDQQVPAFQIKYPSAGPLLTQRHHCIAWSDWTTGAEVQFSKGMRLDTSYYFWPPSWVDNKPGLFTGSAMPMRFAKLDGSFVDVYLAATQMTDESGQAYPYTIDTLLDRALGPEGYYGAYTVNAHTDLPTIPESDAVLSSALSRGVSIISARQLLTWLDARNASSFSGMSYSAGILTFNVSKDPAAQGLRGMLPFRSGNSVLVGLSRGGTAVPFTIAMRKGVEYALFAADTGTHAATYAADAGAPQVTSTTPASGATNVALSVRPAAVFSEALDPATVSASTVELRNSANALVAAAISYDPATGTVTITPSSALSGATAYTATLRGGVSDPRVKDAAGNPLASTVTWSFTTAAPANCPCGAWGASTAPTNPSVADPNAVELGVKFRSDLGGYITGVRFYKGTGNTGTHIGNLWSANGSLLASATFTGESGSGWQQVNFPAPVAITAGTVYVASYFAPNGNYAADSLYFANSGVDNAPIHLLQNGVSGGNGVYAYGPASSFPSSSYQSSNYWVDVVFNTTGPADTTAPTVASTIPGAGATAVSSATTVSATFSEAMDPATVNGSTVELRTPTNALVTAAVSYSAATGVVTLVPGAALAASTTYTATVRGGATDPRVKDVAGNALAANFTWTFTTAPVGGVCVSPPNAIVAENCLVGNSATEWDINGVGDTSIQGYATQISVNRGSTVSFKVNTSASAYRFDIYRMGYYGGAGARKVATVTPSAELPQSQPNCLSDSATGLIDCGNWAVSGSWTVPANVVSGIYFAKVVRTDTGGASHIVFIVRDDTSTSDLLFQTSDTTWQAYNSYGGNSLYTGAPVGRAYKVSYNRPFNTRIVDGGQDWVFNSEYPMVRWLESNGYNVSYTTGVDSDRSGSLILNHRAFLSVGHDEYWSAAQRSNVEAARNAGVNLAFFSGNEVFWKTRWENSIDGSATPYRTLVTYKETQANAKIDPNAAWTGTWRDPRFSPPADGGRPENALTGTIFAVNAGTAAIVVPEADGKMRFWRNTSVASLATGAVATLPNGTLGYEWDIDADNGARPPGLIRMSTTTVGGVDLLQDFGSTYATGTATHNLTLYRHSSGARVFGAGTIQWAWGLDATHDRSGTPSDVRMQQATVNLLADMNAQPATLQSTLVTASASTDTTAPTATMLAPVAGANVSTSAVTISGTASDVGGVVGAVEVSVDGGATWRPATGRATWTFNWTPAATGTYNLRARAVDDSGNIELAGSGITVTVVPQACPCTLWPASAVPAVPSDADTSAVNLGVKFRADVDGFITGVRFYKGSANTGTHIGALWTGGGTQLASATFSGETASGWQQVNFASPVAVTANTVYVASYLAPNGRYAGDNNYFASAGVDSPPLHALQNGVNGGNGVYAYAGALAFPNSSYASSNYWVDVVFTTASTPDTTAPTVSTLSPANAATGVPLAAALTATFSEAMNAATITTSTFELRNSANVLVPATVSYNAGTQVATLTPGAALSGSTVYTATVTVGVRDVAGNAMASNRVWSFTTAASDTTPPTVSSLSPASGATGVSVTTVVTATFSEAMNAATVGASTFLLRNPSGVLVAATVNYNASTRVATLTPSSALTGSTVYTATVTVGAQDAAGNAMASDRIWSFTTAASDTTPPAVSSISPASGATGVGVTTAVTATFSENMNAATIGTNTFELRNSTGVLVTATVNYNASTRVATLTPGSALTGSTVFTATVRGGTTAPVVTDVAGNAMVSNRVWSFTTVETTPPTITSTVPVNGATGVSGTADITATFSEAMTATTINSNTVQLRDAANNLVTATVSYNATTRVATLNPSPTLTQGALYTVTVRGGTSAPVVTDLAGNAMASDRVWSFRIAADTTAPTVTSISPSNGAILISRTANVTATFSEAMDASTISAGTFELRGPNGALVPAVVTYNTSTRVATLNPNASLAGFTSYSVTIRGGASDPRVKDVAGNALATSRVWSFSTL